MRLETDKKVSDISNTSFTRLGFELPNIILRPLSRDKMAVINKAKKSQSSEHLMLLKKWKPPRSNVAKRLLGSPLMKGRVPSNRKSQTKVIKNMKHKTVDVMKSSTTSHKWQNIAKMNVSSRKNKTLTPPIPTPKIPNPLTGSVFGDWQREVKDTLQSLEPKLNVSTDVDSKSPYRRGENIDVRGDVWHMQGGGKLRLKPALQKRRRRRQVIQTTVGPMNKHAARLLGLISQETDEARNRPKPAAPDLYFVRRASVPSRFPSSMQNLWEDIPDRNPMWKSMRHCKPKKYGESGSSTAVFKDQLVNDFDTSRINDYYLDTKSIPLESTHHKKKLFDDNKRKKLNEGDLSEINDAPDCSVSIEDSHDESSGINEKHNKNAIKTTKEIIESVEKAHNNQLDSIFWTNSVLSPIAAAMDHSALLPSRYQLNRTQTRLMYQPDPIKRKFAQSHNSGESFPYAPHAHEAAFKIQRLFRQKSRLRHHHVIGMQRLFRSYIIRRKIHQRRMYMMHVLPSIQRMVRGMLARKNLREDKYIYKQHRAVIIQKRIRGNFGRQLALQHAKARQHDKAIVIQCAIRGYIWRKSVRKKRVEDAAPTVQRYMRGLTTKASIRRHVEMHSYKAQLIKAMFRGAQGRRWARLKKFERLCKGSLQIQRHCRGLLARLYAKARYNAVIKAQSGARYFLGLLAFEKMRMIAENKFVHPKIDAERERILEWLKTFEGKRFFKQKKIELKQKLREEKLASKLLDPEIKARREMRETFNMFDLDGSGLIDRREFKSVVDAMGEPFTAAELDASFREMDEDGSGEVDYGEFKHWWLSKTSKSGAKIQLLKVKLKAYRAMRVLIGAEINQLTHRHIMMEKTAIVVRRARIWWRTKRQQPKYSCKTCLSGFVTSRILHYHMTKGLCKETDVTRLPCRFFDD